MPQALSAITTVMDTIEVLQARQEIHRPEELADRVRAVYRNQSLPVEEAVLQQAVRLYFDQDTHPVPVAPTAPKAVAQTPSGGGLGLLEVGLALVFSLTLLTATYGLYRHMRPKTALAHVVPALIEATHQSPVEANHRIESELKADLGVLGAEVKVVPDPPSGPWAPHPTLQVIHADSSVVAALSQAALAMNTPLTVNGNEVHSFTEAVLMSRNAPDNTLELKGAAP